MKGKRKRFLSVLFAVIITVLFAVPTFAKPKLNMKKATVLVGKSVKLKVTGTNKKPKWYSSDKTIASVSKKGVVKGLRAGKAIIKAKIKGKTLKCMITVTPSSDSDKSTLYSYTPGEADNKNGVTLTFQQDGWYVARLEVQVYDKSKKELKWIYSDSCTKGQKTTITIDKSRYEMNRVGYQIWFFGWDNDYCNYPWANTDFATYFILSGYGDYPEFTWK